MTDEEQTFESGRDAARPVRVLHVITRMIVGGAQENTLLTAKGVNELPGFTVDLVSGVDDGSEGDMLGSIGSDVAVTVIPEMRRNISPVADIVALWKLYRFMQRNNYDIVHTHLAKAGVLGRMAARMAGVPIVVHGLHGMVFNDYQPWIVNRAYWAAQRAIDPFTDHYVSVSTVVSEKAVESGIGDRQDHTTIYSGMELDWFVHATVDQAGARKRWNIPDDALVVGKVARMAPVKGYDRFLDAAPSVLAQHPETYFLLVGDGPLRSHIQERAQSMGIADRVVIPGLLSRKEIPEAIAAMDVMAHAALYEGLPRVIVQALASGKPVVAFDADGTREVVRSDETGYLIKPGDTAAFAAAVNKLLGDPALRTTLGRAGRSRVDPAFRVETMVDDTQRLYRRLVGERDRSSQRGRG